MAMDNCLAVFIVITRGNQKYIHMVQAAQIRNKPLWTDISRVLAIAEILKALNIEH